MNFLTTHELEKIRNAHTSGLQLTRLSIDRLFNEVDIAKEDVRVIELKIDATYAMNGALKAEIEALKGQIDGYKMRYENTGSMFGRRDQAATIEENKLLNDALMIAYTHCSGNEMDTITNMIECVINLGKLPEYLKLDIGKGKKLLGDRL